MSKRFKISFLGVILFFIWINISQAKVQLLTVQFQNKPLFSGFNFFPGDSVTRWVKITNNSGRVQKILIKTGNVVDVSKIGDALRIKIKKGTEKYFDDKLSAFLNGNPISLTDLNNGVNAEYDLTISFDSSAGESYQYKSLTFDILVGYDDSQDSNNNGIYLSDNPEESDIPIIETVSPTPSASPTYSPEKTPDLSESPIVTVIPDSSVLPAPSRSDQAYGADISAIERELETETSQPLSSSTTSPLNPAIFSASIFNFLFKKWWWFLIAFIIAGIAYWLSGRGKKI
jgi:hypothetical protein